MLLPRVEAARYVLAMREGGSMPGLLLADDDRYYVVKMRGAGQGPLVLVAEVLAAAIADALALPVPQLAVVNIPERFGVNEPDPEIRALLRSSTGANIGLGFLAEATTFDLAAGDPLTAEFAARVVWLDSFLMNVDRTARNPNLLLQQGRPYLIDHGAALYPQYDRATFLQRASSPFPQIKDHLLLPAATGFEEHAQQAREALAGNVIADAVGAVPGDLWPREDENGHAPVAEQREVYRAFLFERLRHASIFEEEVLRAQRTIHTGV